MITKKDLLQKIANKEIKTLDQIEKKYLQDDDVLKLYLMTFHQHLLTSSNNIKKKLDELVKDLKIIGPKKWLKSQIEVKKRIEGEIIVNRNIKPYSPYDDIKIKEDQNLIISIMRKPSKLKDLNNDLKKNIKIFKEALKLHALTYKYIHDDLKIDNEFNLKVLNEINASAFKYFPKEVKQNLDIQKAAVLNNVLDFENTDELLKNDRDFVNKIIIKKPNLYKFISQKLKLNKDFNFNLLITTPSVYSYLDENLQKEKKFVLKAIKINTDIFQYLIPKLQQDEDITAASINDQRKSDAIDEVNKTILGNLKIIDKEFILNYLEEKIDQSYLYEGYSPYFIEYLNPELLRDEDVLSKILDFKCDMKLIFDNFNEFLIKKYEKKKLTIEYAYNFWDGNPLYPEIFYFYHGSKIRDFDTTTRSDLHYECLDRSADFTYRDLSIINDVFSKIEFNSEYLNRYYKRPNEIPEEGFPPSLGAGVFESDDDTILHERDFDEEELKDNPNTRFIVNYEHVYEIDKEGKEIFSTFNYVAIQMFYSSLKYLFASLEEQFSNKKIMSKFDELLDSKKLNDFIYNYAYIFLDEVKNKVDRKKLKKLFIKELNLYLSDFDISIRDCKLYDSIWPSEMDDDDPASFTQFQFFVDYKGIKNRIKFSDPFYK